MIAGVSSVAFRALPPEGVIDLAAGAGLSAIEWGADVHLPPGDAAAARALARRCADVGLACPSYGSYLFVGRSPTADAAPVLETAVALGAGTVRVWATEDATPDDVASVVDQARAAGTTISLEFHPGTATETAAGALDLLDAVGRPGLFTYWQPVPGDEPARSLTELAAVTARLSHLHVFWWFSADDRRSLAEGKELWPAALAAVDAAAPGTWTGPRVAYIEFVRGDEPDQLRADASTLRTWLDAALSAAPGSLGSS